MRISHVNQRSANGPGVGLSGFPGFCSWQRLPVHGIRSSISVYDAATQRIVQIILESSKKNEVWRSRVDSRPSGSQTVCCELCRSFTSITSCSRYGGRDPWTCPVWDLALPCTFTSSAFLLSSLLVRAPFSLSRVVTVIRCLVIGNALNCHADKCHTALHMSPISKHMMCSVRKQSLIERAPLSL